MYGVRMKTSAEGIALIKNLKVANLKLISAVLPYGLLVMDTLLALKKATPVHRENLMFYYRRILRILKQRYKNLSTYHSNKMNSMRSFLGSTTLVELTYGTLLSFSALTTIVIVAGLTFLIR